MKWRAMLGEQGENYVCFWEKLCFFAGRKEGEKKLHEENLNFY
jgi:hypothetical protein